MLDMYALIAMNVLTNANSLMNLDMYFSNLWHALEMYHNQVPCIILYVCITR